MNEIFKFFELSILLNNNIGIKFFINYFIFYKKKKKKTPIEN